MIHIGISGPIAAGKSTLAQQLEQHFNARIIPFAYGVKQLASYELFADRLHIMTQRLVQYGATYPVAFTAASMIDGFMNKYPSQVDRKNRRLLQFIGVEAGRNTIHPDIWIDVVQARKPLAYSAGYDVVISDDLRFDNEAAAVDIHIGIVADDCYAERKQKLDAQYTFSNHPSEQSLTAEPDIIIPACWTEQDLANVIAIITVALD